MIALVCCRTHPYLQQVCRFQGSQGVCVFLGALQPQHSHDATDKVDRLCWQMRVCHAPTGTLFCRLSAALAASRCRAARAGVATHHHLHRGWEALGASGCHAQQGVCLQRFKSDTPACCSGCVREWAFQSCLFGASRRFGSCCRAGVKLSAALSGARSSRRTGKELCFGPGLWPGHVPVWCGRDQRTTRPAKGVCSLVPREPSALCNTHTCQTQHAQFPEFDCCRPTQHNTTLYSVHKTSSSAAAAAARCPSWLGVVGRSGQPCRLFPGPAPLLPGCSCSRASTCPSSLYCDTMALAKLGMCCAARLLPMCLRTTQRENTAWVQAVTVALTLSITKPVCVVTHPTASPLRAHSTQGQLQEGSANKHHQHQTGPETTNHHWAACASTLPELPPPQTMCNLCVGPATGLKRRRNPHTHEDCWV